MHELTLRPRVNGGAKGLGAGSPVTGRRGDKGTGLCCYDGTLYEGMMGGVQQSW